MWIEQTPGIGLELIRSWLRPHNPDDRGNQDRRIRKGVHRNSLPQQADCFDLVGYDDRIASSGDLTVDSIFVVGQSIVQGMHDYGMFAVGLEIPPSFVLGHDVRKDLIQVCLSSAQAKDSREIIDVQLAMTSAGSRLSPGDHVSASSAPNTGDSGRGRFEDAEGS
jgi:hypothetical protein